jgi:hypothetical protein
MYTLLTPLKLPKPDRSAITILDLSTISQLGQLDKLVAVDIETNGTKAHDPDCRIVGIGIADHSNIFYIPIDSEPTLDAVLQQLWGRELVGFNIYFDAAFLHREFARSTNGSLYGPGQHWLDWKWDVYSLFKNLASEGWKGQEWGLKHAQKALLGWEQVGDVELGQWLVDNGYIADTKLEWKDGYCRYKNSDGEVRFGRPDKSQMYKAPVEILGYYCGLDAASTYMLLAEVFQPALAALPPPVQENYTFYHQQLYWSTVKWHIEQQFNGLKINLVKLQKHADTLKHKIVEAEQKFLAHPEVAPYVTEFNLNVIKAHMAKEPAEYKKPPKRNPNSKRPPPIPVTSKSWMNWSDKLKQIAETNHFNINSGTQKEWLFYEKMGKKVLVRTEKGNPATDKKALQAWGEPGLLLKAQNDAVKELSYVEKCLEVAGKDGKVHTQFNMVGTLTGRLSGTGGFNIQQQPKSKGYFECIVPTQGVFVECDVNALEAVVLAELSKDDTMRYLYHPDSPKQDIYLYVGSFLPGVGEHIRAAGYDPENPTREGIEMAKHKAKHYRQIAKACTLGFQYNMGPKKLRQTLGLQGVELTEEQAYAIYKAYWDLFGGIRKYARWAEDQWRLRGGWVLNGMGLPTPVYSDYLSDIVNRTVQSTGHQVLMWINWRLWQLREETGLEFYPAIVDWHDATMVECDESVAQEVVALFKQTYKELNEWLAGDLPIRGEPQIVKSLAQAKCE